jgi:hypothetical protein
MSEPEYLDLPDGYDPDGGWSVQEWWDALGYGEPSDYGLRRVRDLRTAPGLLDGVDEQRPADFDDEETRP